MPGYGLERKGVGVHNGIPTRIHEEGGQVNSSRSRLLTGMGKKLPTTKASLFVLVAFAIWYSEDYLLFANPRITMLSFNSVVAESVPPNVIAMSITLGGFLLLFLLYKQRLFAICEGYGLVASSAMTALGAILLNVSWTLESPPWLSVVGFSMITFGHQCFLPENAEGKSLFAVLEDASHAAKAGVDYTKTIAAKKGRASLVGERSIGYEDPGAVSSMLMYRALYAFLKK
jgi:hypothetical protein